MTQDHLIGLDDGLTVPASPAAPAERGRPRFAFVDRLAGLPLGWLLMGLSGLAGLGWQMVWTAQLGAVLGHEMVAVLAVLAAFFGGLAIGALTLGRAVARSRFPGRGYAACELAIALWGASFVWISPGLMGIWADWVGAQPSALRHWLLAFVGPFLLLLPATMAMGATLPAAERMLGARDSVPASTPLGGLYAANTAGAVAGALLSAFWLVPAFGLLRTGLLCSGLNLLCAVAALAWWRVPVAPAGRPGFAGLGRVSRSLWTLAATGLLGIGFEVFAVRLLSQVTENTVYSYAFVLAVYLLGTAIGAAGYQMARQRLAGRIDAATLERELLTALALAVAIGGWVLGWADALVAWPSRAFGPGLLTALAGEGAAALAALLPPTLLMGALFSHLCARALADGDALGSAVAVNTVGAALAAPVAGVLLLPLLGARVGIALLALAYLLLVPTRRFRLPAAATAGVALALCFAPRLGWGGASGGPAFVDVPPGGRVLSHREGVMAAVSVIEDADGVARLRINNRQQEGSSASGIGDARLAWLPLLLHPQPRRALLLGLGTGATADAAAEDARLQVDVVELLPEVVAAAAEFPRSAPRPARPPRVIVGDARRYVRSAGARYDVIVADLFHPARSGSGALYTVEHFAAVRERLADGGVFCQWLALHQMDLSTLRSIVAAFLQVFPEADAVLAGNSLSTPVLGLIAHPQSPRLELSAIRSRLADPQGAERRAALGLADEFAVLGSVVAGPSALAAFAGDAPANTDERPRVAHRAPFATYAPEAAPAERLLAVLAALDVRAGELIDTPDSDTGRRLSAYWLARDRYIEIGAGMRPDPDPRVMLDRVQAPLLEVLLTSADFRPAYEPLLALAIAVARLDRERARRLLGELVELAPARPEAAQALQGLS
jgi:spermidine synthase